MNTNQEASEQVKRAIIQAAWTHYAAPEFDEIDMEPRRTKLVTLMTETILPFLAPPVAAPTQKAVEAAEEVEAFIRNFKADYDGTPTVWQEENMRRTKGVASIIQRICFPVPATATEGEDELAVLRETIKAIEAVNVDEFGGKADLAISRLIESIPQAIAARHPTRQWQGQINNK